jgi:cobalt/nickel transport system permease protein
MHISEGVLSPAIIAGGYALAAAGTYVGLKRMDYSRLTTAATLASVFFTGSLVHVPLGPGSVHLILNGLLGVFLGWGVFPALFVALSLQAVLFGHGGAAVLGVNVCTVAFPALLCHYAVRGMIAGSGASRRIGGFLCGAVSVAGAAVLTALALGFSDRAFLTSAKLIVLAHIPVMALEGIITAAIIGFVAKSRPELLRSDSNPATGDYS